MRHSGPKIRVVVPICWLVVPMVFLKASERQYMNTYNSYTPQKNNLNSKGQGHFA